MILVRASCDLDIAASAEVLFDLLAPQRGPEWDRSIRSVAEIRGPLGPGARYRETHRILLRAHSIDFEVTDYEPPQRIGFRTVRGGPPATTRYELLVGREQNQKRTTLTYEPAPLSPRIESGRRSARSVGPEIRRAGLALVHHPD
jgi:hypothetical protein